MPADQPSREVAALYNELIRLPFSAGPRIENIELSLRRLAHSDPRDSAIRVALMQAYIMLGQIENALSQAEAVWKMGRMPQKVEKAYISLLVDIGLYDWALELLRGHLDRVGEGYEQLAFVTGVGGGDLNLMARSAGMYDAQNPEVERIRGFVAALEQAGARGHFQTRQRLASRFLFGKQSAFEATVLIREGQTEDEPARYVLDQAVFSPLEVVERYRLQNELDRQMRSCDEEAGLPEMKSIRLRIYELSSHVPPKGGGGSAPAAHSG